MRFMWDSEMDAKLLEMFYDNKTANEICDYFTCANSQLYARCRVLGISFRQRNEILEDVNNPLLKHFNKVDRPCLRCKQDFLSEGKFNRICNECRRMNAGYPGVVYG